MAGWDESEHPRWPARTPGGRGGEFRGTERWIQQTLAGMHLDATPEQEILHILVSGREIDRTELSGGNSAETSIVTFRMADGSTHKLITKTSNPTDARNETLASAIAREAFDAPVPVVVRDPHGMKSRIWMSLVNGYSPMQRMLDDWRSFQGEDIDEDLDYEAVDWDSFWDYAHDEEDEVIEEYAHGYDGATLGLFDLVTRMGDRHTGNWLIRYGTGGDAFENREIVGIDHTHQDAFTEIDEDDDVSVDWWSSPFAKALLVEDEGGDVGSVNWHPADIAQAHKHLEALLARPDIVRLLDELGSDPEVFLSRLRWVGRRANPGAPRRFQ